MQKCNKINFPNWFIIYTYYSPSNICPGDKTSKTYFSIEVYPKQSWGRSSHCDPKYDFHQWPPSYFYKLMYHFVPFFFFLIQTANANSSTQSQVKVVLFTWGRFNYNASHHSEYLIFMKSEFLLWHGTNWIEVKRTVYAEYYSSKPVAAEAAGRWTIVEICLHISTISKRFALGSQLW